MRVTHSLVLAAQALLTDPTAERYGRELAEAAGLRTGVLQPILRRMLTAGWLTSRWERRSEITGVGSRRPLRRYMKLTPVGVTALQGILDAAADDPRFTTLTTTPPVSGTPPHPVMRTP